MVYATTRVCVRNANSGPIKSQIVSYNLCSLPPLNNFQHFVGFRLFFDSNNNNSNNYKKFFIKHKVFSTFLHN